ncbi:MAG: DUF4157 domain-containing protein [Dechloromonas sp.]|nr:MAG: DUF4157 domain-containing protein [Dechloromonas sp.]
MKQYSPARLADTANRASPGRPGREQDADRRAIHAFDTLAQPQRALPRAGISPVSSTTAAHSLKPAGKPSPRPCAPFEQAFGHDFSQVRVFASGETANAVRAAGSRAIAYGPHIALAPGQWAPETATGRALLAHELAHVAQQAGEGRPRLDHKTLDEEIDEELKAKASDPKSLNPNNAEYARTLQAHGHDITHKSPTELLPEPKDPRPRKPGNASSRNPRIWPTASSKAALMSIKGNPRRTTGRRSGSCRVH